MTAAEARAKWQRPTVPQCDHYENCASSETRALFHGAQVHECARCGGRICEKCTRPTLFADLWQGPGEERCQLSKRRRYRQQYRAELAKLMGKGARHA